MRIDQFRIMRIIRAISAISAVMIVITTVLNSCLAVKLFRCIDSAQKALSKVDKAAELYIADNTKANKNSD